MTVELGYWKIRGLGAVIRMILEYKEAAYNDVQYDSQDAWFKKRKPEIREINPLANLPYLIDGDICVCQTNAVMNYLGQKFELSGDDIQAKIWNAQLLCEIYDVREAMMDLVYPFKNVNRNEAEFIESAGKLLQKPIFSKFESWLEMYGYDYFCSSKPCTCDFHIWEMIDQHELLAKKFLKESPLANFPRCKAFYERFRGLPTLQKYFESDSYKLPINDPSENAYFQ